MNYETGLPGLPAEELVTAGPDTGGSQHCPIYTAVPADGVRIFSWGGEGSFYHATYVMVAADDRSITSAAMFRSRVTKLWHERNGTRWFKELPKNVEPLLFVCVANAMAAELQSEYRKEEPHAREITRASVRG